MGGWFDTLVKLAGQLNGIEMLGICALLALITGQRGMWVFKREVDQVTAHLTQVQRERDEYRLLAFRGTGIAEQVVDTIVKKPVSTRRSHPKVQS